MIRYQAKNEIYPFVEGIAQRLEMLFVEFAESIKISRDSILRMCLLQLLENDTALDHELRRVGELEQTRRRQGTVIFTFALGGETLLHGREKE